MNEELLEALRGMLDYFGQPRRDEWSSDVAFQQAKDAESRARAAVAKAMNAPKIHEPVMWRYRLKGVPSEFIWQTTDNYELAKRIAGCNDKDDGLSCDVEPLFAAANAEATDEMIDAACAAVPDLYRIDAMRAIEAALQARLIAASKKPEEAK